LAKDSLNLLFSSMQEAIKSLLSFEVSKVQIIHHDDADGLCAASIVKDMLEKKGFNIETICIEKLFPEVINKLHSTEGKVYIYVDIGSAHASKISAINKSKNLTIILDHHDFEESTDPLVYNLNPEVYGISGEEEASGSTVAYFFAKNMDKQNTRLAHLAVIGAAEIPGPLKGLNLEALKDALKNNLVEVEGEGDKIDVKVLCLGKPLSYRRLSTMLTILGSVGYYADGPRKGIKACLEGFTGDIEETILKLEEKRRRANRRMLEKLKSNGINQLSSIQWFHAYDMFKGMGTKVIGTFCSYLSYQKIVHPTKYLIGIMNMSREIPGFGLLKKDYVKVSARTPKTLSFMIKEGKKPPLSKILPEACKHFNGFGDGHSTAASGVIVKGVEKEFISLLEKLSI